MKLKKILPLMLAASLLLGGAVEAKNFKPPTLTAEFDQMAFMQLYPTYSWEPLPKTEFYQVRVVDVEKNQVVRELFNTEALNRVTDSQAFTTAGEYYWQVRVVDKNHKPLSDWSEKKFFKVEMPVEFAALGDSLTHGGSAYIPAGQLSCQWETFCEVPIKNLGRSGDTTAMMIERFDKDVLPFAPKILVIMGGVNDIRGGMKSDAVIKNLETLRDKCLANDITPVFCTLTSMNPDIMKARGIFLTDDDWREEREKINLWIRTTPYFIDVTEGLIDEFGYLYKNLAPDGLHPALRGKKIMGELISDYLKKNFQ